MSGLKAKDTSIEDDMLKIKKYVLASAPTLDKITQDKISKPKIDPMKQQKR